MNRCSMADAKRVYEALRIFVSRGSNWIAQRVTQKVLARNRFNGNKLIPMKDLRLAPDRIKDGPRGFGHGFCRGIIQLLGVLPI